MTGRERVLALLEGREPDRIPLMPITMMFAARQIGARYRDYASDFRVLAEAQIATAEKFGFDYVSTISDPAREPSDLGAVLEWFDDQPPALNESQALLHDKSVLARLRPADPHSGPRMSDRVCGVELLKQRAGAELLIEGWVEGPCAEAADLRGINALMTDFVDDPDFVRDLFAFAVEMELGFARAQIEAGADIIGVGDAAASLVGPAIYREFVLPYEQKLVDGIHAAGGRVRLHICGKTRRLFAGMGSLGCEIVDLDWMAPLGEARAAMGPDQVLLGNLDPVAVLRAGTPESVREAARQCRQAAAPRWIAGAGCEVAPDTPEENLRALCEYARP
jgi:MtaA/CmuA family methyltransferase